MINKIIPLFGKRRGGGGGTLLLDLYPTDGAAFSLRYLRTAYIGSPVIRVRRSSDNLENDFTPDEITDGTLESWVGVGNNGFISIFYDQSGNGRNGVQSVLAYQRILVNSGILITTDGKPSDDYITGSRAYEITPFAFSAPFTIFALGKPDASGSEFYQGEFNNGTSILNDNITRFYGGNFISITHSLGLSRILSYALFNGVSSEFNVNGFINSGDIGALTNPLNFGFAGYYKSSGQVFTGKFQEIIIYTSDQSSNSSSILSDINTYYSVY